MLYNYNSVFRITKPLSTESAAATQDLTSVKSSMKYGAPSKRNLISRECICYSYSKLIFLYSLLFITDTTNIWRTAVAQWLRCCATNRKVAGSIPDGVIGIFH